MGKVRENRAVLAGMVLLVLAAVALAVFGKRSFAEGLTVHYLDVGKCNCVLAEFLLEEEG